MRTKARKSSDRQSLAGLVAGLLAESAEVRLELRQVKAAVARIESELAANYRESHALTLELMERERCRRPQS